MAKDPYRYFRVEARELIEGLTGGILAVERGPATPGAYDRLLRMAHTLKGAARVVRQGRIAELAHAIEDALAPYRADALPLPGEQASAFLSQLDAITGHLRALESAPDVERTRPTATSTAEEPLETVRVDLEEMEALLRSVSSASIQAGAMRRRLGAADRLQDLARLLVEHLASPPGDAATRDAAAPARARALAEELGDGLVHLARGLTADAERLAGGLDTLHDLALRLRLVPVRTVFPTLERAARDAAEGLGIELHFETAGGDARLDAQVLASLRDALMHAVRNAVAHGIEPRVERRAAGKPEQGVVRLTARRSGDRVTFVCEDDGRGIDQDAVRAAAVARGLVAGEAADRLGAPEILALLGHSGLTTATQVTELSGRGVGLDVVRTTAARLKGEVHVRSEPGQGTAIEVTVPVSIASLYGLLVDVAGSVAVIPLDAVRQTLRVLDAEICRTADRASIVHSGNVIPFWPLDETLTQPASVGRQRRVWSAVVVRAGERELAVGVDRLLGTTHVVMRALPAVVEADPAIAGASLDADGNPLLVLDPVGLLQSVERGLRQRLQEPSAPRPPVLVVDDSLTTRMLEQSILESAGYEVELAVSAEDGLEKARARRYGIFVVDVEMPGMDGFGFVAETRADPTLRDIPAILVTSRDAPEDRRRGATVGAGSYIVKGEFDQGVLLGTIRRLMGT